MATFLPPQPIGVPPDHSYWTDWYEKLRTIVNNSLKGIVSITGGTIDGTTIGGTVPSVGTFTSLTSTHSSTDFQDVTTTLSPPAYKEGRLFYDNVDKTLAYYNDNSQVTVNIGQETLVRIYNNTGTTLANGSVVYISGATSGVASVSLAQANTNTASTSILGIVTDTILNSTYGYASISGTVHALDTSSYTAGQVLYLSSTVAGSFTGTAPLQPNYVVVVGYVLTVSATVGSVLVYVHKSDWFPSLELLDTTASVTLPTVPTIYKPPTTVYNDGFTYSSTTGEITVNTTASYTISVLFNALPSAANKNIYYYTEYNVGAGWVISRYSAKQLELVTGTQTQLSTSSAHYWPAGTKLRFTIWGDSTVSLKTADLPGTTPGTVTLPAFRLLIAG